MDVMSLVSAQMSAQVGRAQMTVAASIMKTNAGHDAEKLFQYDRDAAASRLSRRKASTGINAHVACFSPEC